MNGLCPACRRPYDEKTIQWKVVTSEEYVTEPNLFRHVANRLPELPSSVRISKRTNEDGPKTNGSKSFRSARQKKRTAKTSSGFESSKRTWSTSLAWLRQSAKKICSRPCGNLNSLDNMETYRRSQSATGKARMARISPLASMLRSRSLRRQRGASKQYTDLTTATASSKPSTEQRNTAPHG